MENNPQVAPETESEIIDARTDRFTLTAASATLAIVSVLGLIGIIILSARGDVVPDVLQNLVFGAIGFLGGHLTKDR